MLTMREQQVVASIAAGGGVAAAATRLGIAASTVKVYLRFAKYKAARHPDAVDINVNQNAGLVLFALRAGWIT